MTTKTVAPLSEIVAKATGIREALRAQLVERDTQLAILFVAIVARVHVMLHGDPGNAKSMTVDGILRYMPEIRQFKTQAYKGSPPEQFLGPISFSAMEQDRYERIIAGKFADCEIAFIDETPRMPRALAPAFQGGMVEREFDNGSGPIPIPLMSFIGTSNHILDDPELEAFFDRFTFKLVVKPPLTQDSFIDIMRKSIERRRDPSILVPDPDLLISREELVALQDAVAAVHIPDDVLVKLGELWGNVLAAGVQPSIRRYTDLLASMQSQAVLSDRDEVIQDDLLLAIHSLWTVETDIDAVYEETIKFASQWEQDKSEQVRAFGEIEDRVAKIQADHAQGAAGLNDQAITILQDTKALASVVEGLVADAKGRDASDLESLLSRMSSARGWIRDEILGGLDV